MTKLFTSFIAATLAIAAFANTQATLTSSKDIAEAGAKSYTFSAVARIGDSSLTTKTGEWEMGLGANTNAWSTTKNNSFSNGQGKNFTVNYSAATRQITYTLSGNVLTYQIPADKKTDFLILSAKSTSCSSIRIDCLAFKNRALGAGLQPKANDGGRSYLRLSGHDLSRDWSMCGRVTMNWHGQPKGGALQMELRGVEAVPEPGSIAAIAMGLTALVARKKKK